MRNFKTTVPRAVGILKQLNEKGEMQTFEVARNLNLKNTYHTSTMMAQLRRQNLVSARKEKTKRFYTITSTGLEYLLQYQIQIQIQDDYSIRDDQSV